jgi:hypothetical protein
MERSLPVFIVILLCAVPLSVLSEDVITGQKFQALDAAPDQYVDQSVVLEDTFQGIDKNFSRIETQNYYTPDRYVKFTLAQCPYPCIGMMASIEKSLEQCTPGDLVRVYADLMQINESRTMEQIQGRYSGGPSWDERVYVYGPLKSEYFFNVGHLEKGWGRKDTPEEMFAEGKNLSEAHYQKVTPAELKSDMGKFIEKSVWFEGAFEGLDTTFSKKEKAVGLTPDKNLQFKIKGVDVPCLISKSGSNLEGLKKVAPGSEVQVYGRIRAKETPDGIWGGFFVDRVTRTVPREKAPTKEPEKDAPPPPPVS